MANDEIVKLYDCMFVRVTQKVSKTATSTLAHISKLAAGYKQVYRQSTDTYVEGIKCSSTTITARVCKHMPVLILIHPHFLAPLHAKSPWRVL